MRTQIQKYRDARALCRCGISVAVAAERHNVDRAVLACLVDGERRMRKGVMVWADTHTNGRERAQVLKRHGSNVQVRAIDGQVVYWVPVADCELAN